MSHSFKQKGFSLTELLVTLSIVGLLMTILVTNQNSYTDLASLSSVADDISISISQAQAYGIAVRERVAGSSNFTGAYGITLSILSSGSNKAYLYFGDLDGDLVYDGDWNCAIGSGLECLGKTLIPYGHWIETFCIIPNSGADVCYAVSRVDISFIRPDTDANIVFFNSSGSVSPQPTARGVRIVLRSLKGPIKYVAVYRNGQVSVQ